MDKKQSGLYMNPYMPLLKKYTNLNHTCPYEVSYLYMKY